MGIHGMVAAAHPLASLAGLRILMAGGNAIDAAITTAAALNVAEPYMSGLGGGGYMIVRLDSGETVTLDYSGMTAAAAELSAYDKSSADVGPKAPVVPGAAVGWLTALKRWGTMDAATVFAPAIEYAEQGVALTVKNSMFYTMAGPRLDTAAQQVFYPAGAAPGAGAIIRQPALAATFRQLAAEGADIFYDGSLGVEVIRVLQAAGGFMTMADLQNFKVAFAAPISTTYRGYTLETIPPPCTAFQVLTTLRLLEGYDLAASGQNSADTLHTMIEAAKLATVDRIEHAGKLDPPLTALLAERYVAQRRALIDPERARPIEGERYTRPLPTGAIRPGTPEDIARENTTHFDVADAAGNCVSITQSLGSFFGSGVIGGDTGIMLNNFSTFFDLDPASPNALGPSKPRNSSMAPTIVSRDGKPLLLIGTPGAFGILQTTVQMISNVLDHGYGVQAAIEAPRFRTGANLDVSIESRVPQDVRSELERRGHQVLTLDAWSPAVGGGHGVLIDPETGALSGGADPRRDGYATGW
jgi:gamma-glutamyltranspeptidase/glutathione hydrolase